VFVIGHDLGLYQIDVASGAWTNLATFGNWLTFELSAGLDSNGYAAVWTQNSNDDLVAYDTQPGPSQGSYYSLTLPSYATMISATNNKAAWVLYNGQLVGLDNGLSSITAVSAVSSTDGFVMANGHLYELNVSNGIDWQTWF
jgi:hypothetical protein